VIEAYEKTGNVIGNCEKPVDFWVKTST